MIRYTLKCPEGHGFDSWFATAAAYDRLAAAGHVACPDCGSTRVEKALMAPAVATGEAARRPLSDPPEPGADPRAAAIAALRREIEAKSDYVGLRFAAEARRMHEGAVPERPIHGEARLDEARALLEEGIPVAPLPFLPTRRAN
jgi:hypothetical protein